MYVLVVAVILSGLIAYFVLNYRRLSGERKAIEKSWGALVDHLKERHDMVERLLSECPHFDGAHAEGLKLSEALAAARAAAADPGCAAAETELSRAIGRSFHDLAKKEAGDEAEPFRRWRDQCVAMEDRIILTLDEYNRHTQLYNAQHTVFPTSLICRRLSLKPAESCEIADAFSLYPLKFEVTMPTPRKSFPGLPEPKEASGKE